MLMIRRWVLLTVLLFAGCAARDDVIPQIEVRGNVAERFCYMCRFPRAGSDGIRGCPAEVLDRCPSAVRPPVLRVDAGDDVGRSGEGESEEGVSPIDEDGGPS
jgi:hypothetical protein